MSLLSKITKFAGRLAKGPVGTIASVAFPGVGSLAVGAANALFNPTRPQQSQIPGTFTLPGGLQVGGGTSAILQRMGAVPSLPALPGTGFSTGGGFPAAKPQPTMANGQVCAPSGFHFAKDGSGRLVRNRRMNPLNPRAARRAIRRIKSLRKVCNDIERQLPKRTVRAAARRR